MSSDIPLPPLDQSLERLRLNEDFKNVLDALLEMREETIGRFANVATGEQAMALSGSVVALQDLLDMFRGETLETPRRESP